MKKIFLSLLILISNAQAMQHWSEAKIEHANDSASMIYNATSVTLKTSKSNITGVSVKHVFTRNCDKIYIKFLVQGKPLTNKILNVNGKQVEFKLGTGFTTHAYGKNITGQYIEPKTNEGQKFLIREFTLKKRVFFTDNDKNYIITGMGFTKKLASLKQICQEQIKNHSVNKTQIMKKILSFLVILIGVIVAIFFALKYISHRKTKKVIKTMHSWNEVEIKTLYNNVYMEDYTITTVGKAHQRTLWARVVMKFRDCGKIDIKFSVMGQPFIKGGEHSKDNIFNLNGRPMKFKIGKNFTGYFNGKEIPKQYIWPATKEDKEFILQQFKTNDKIVLTHQGKKIYTVTTQGFNEAITNLNIQCQEGKKIKNYN